MKRWCLLLVLLAVPALAEAPPERVPVDQFGSARFYKPDSKTPASFVVVLSPSTGWDDTAHNLAQQLRQDGAAVLGLDVKSYYANRAQSNDECLYPTGLIEDQAEKLQKHFREQGFERPMLIGLGDSGSLAAVTTLQTLPGTYRGVIAPDFCAPVLAPKPLCVDDDVKLDGNQYHPGNASTLLQIETLHLAQGHDCPGQNGVWPVGPAVSDAAQYVRLSMMADARAVRADSIADLADLPLTYLPSADKSNDWLIVFVSGDGGWRDIDRQIGKALQQAGYAVVGLDSLQYFWSKKTPAQTAAVLDRIVTSAARSWGKRHIALAGYSFGAEILPFTLPLMRSKDLVRQLSFVGFSKNASFEITVGGFLGHGDKNYNTRQAVRNIKQTPILCIYGDEEVADGDTICPELTQDNIARAMFPGGHHYNQDYARLAQRVIAELVKLSTADDNKAEKP